MWVGSVSYLNAKPLIHGLGISDRPGTPEGLGEGEAGRSVRVETAVPSALLELALRADDPPAMVLLPVADLVRHADVLRPVPVGCIACRGPTWTVRLYGRGPWSSVRRLHADTDSHTSVTLARLTLKARSGVDPEVVALPEEAVRQLHAGLEPAGATSRVGFSEADALLLIGDKVVTHPPPRSGFPVELDLGEAWYRETGLPFVFAVWCRPRASPPPPAWLVQRMRATRAQNLARLASLVRRFAGPHGWPEPLAADYLGRVLRYRVGDGEVAGMRRYRAEGIAGGVLPAGPDPFEALEAEADVGPEDDPLRAPASGPTRQGGR